MVEQTNSGATLLDSLQGGLIAAAEIGGNRLLGLDETALAACAEMQGQCIAIDITDINFQLYCHPGDWGIRLSRFPPAGDVDATISGHLLALLNLMAQQDKISTSIREQVRFHGNVGLAQRLQKIAANLDIDWEEVLAEHTGDVLAVQIHRGMQTAGRWFRDSANSFMQTTSEYLREEARLTPTQVEFDHFQAEVTALKYDLARIEARLQRLIDSFETTLT